MNYKILPVSTSEIENRLSIFGVHLIELLFNEKESAFEKSVRYENKEL